MYTHIAVLLICIGFASLKFAINLKELQAAGHNISQATIIQLKVSGAVVVVHRSNLCTSLTTYIEFACDNYYNLHTIQCMKWKGKQCTTRRVSNAD